MTSHSCYVECSENKLNLKTMVNTEPSIKVVQALQVSDFGISPDQTTWSRVSLSSNHLISISHQSQSTQASKESILSIDDAGCTQVHILHSDGKVVSKSRTVAESSKLHPTKNIIALQAHNVFQVVNFESQNLVCEMEFPNDLQFWKWTDEEAILIVTENSVYQWEVFRKKAEPELIFRRLPRLHLTEIVNCTVDESRNWYTVTGLLDHSQHGGGIEGITQVYSVGYNLSQCIEAHASVFYIHKFHDNASPSTVMCAACRHLDSANGKIHTIELGPAIHGNLPLRTYSHDIKLIETAERDDFPVSVQADVDHGVLYVLTKYGYFFLADLETAVTLVSQRISPHITFCCSINPLSTLLVVNRAGQVLKITVDWLRLIQIVRNGLNKPQIADRLQNSRGMENVDLLHITDD